MRMARAHRRVGRGGSAAHREGGREREETEGGSRTVLDDSVQRND